MALAPGTKLGPYQIESPIGAGGMGEVYKATDTRLERTVAIKVLPAHVASDPDLRQRFEREAKTISSLNHPHICTLHDVGKEGDIDFLVMEYLEGETLAQRLTKGALPLDQALGYAIEIADALDKAHRQGVTHRDLKPGNIMLTKAGAKLLDFGLAKLKAPGAGSDASIQTAKALTQPGTILGTYQYMAPEQLENKLIDGRADVFAFGAVVYEMLTGQKAFDGSSQASLIAAILDTDPPAPSTLQPMTPPALDRVVKKCLVKDPDGRWQSAGDLADNLRWLRADSPAPHGEMPPARPLPDSAHARRMWRVAGVGLLLTLGATGWWFWVGSRTAPPTPVSVTHTQVTFNGDVVDEALSPDGRTVAYAVGVQSNGVRVLVRDLAGGEALEIWQGQGISTLHWTPDGAQLLVSGVPDQGPRQVVLIPRLGGPPRRVAALNAPFMAVSPDGSQLMGALENEQGFRVAPMTGGEIHRVELPDIRFVHDVAWDPDGKLVAVVGRNDDGTPAVWP